MKAFDRALGCISSVKWERNKKSQGNDCKPPCQKLWEIFLTFTFPNLTLLFLNLLHYKTQHMCKLLSCCLMKHSFLLPVRQFLQTWGLHFGLATRAEPWARGTAVVSSKGRSFCYFCTSFSNPVELSKTDQMKAKVRFHVFSPKKSYEKLIFVVCGVTIQLHCHLQCSNHMVQESAIHWKEKIFRSRHSHFRPKAGSGHVLWCIKTFTGCGLWHLPCTQVSQPSICWLRATFCLNLMRLQLAGLVMLKYVSALPCRPLWAICKRD